MLESYIENWFQEREKNWKYESSEDSSDSDEDDDFLHKKIQIKIRPKDEVNLI